MPSTFIKHYNTGSSLPALLILTALFQFGCATVTGGRTLDVDTGGIESVQSMPQEISRLLDELGYQWLPVHDPDIGQPIKVAEINGQYRMLFQARDNPAIRIEVHIRETGQYTGLHFYDTGNKQLDAAAQQQYRKLRDRLVLEFGPNHVTDTHPLLTP